MDYLFWCLQLHCCSRAVQKCDTSFVIRHSGKQCNMGADVLLQNRDLTEVSGKCLLLSCPARSLSSPMVIKLE